MTAGDLPADPPPLPVMGWKEIVALPEWGIRDLKAKLDTGAKTSALHVENLVEVGPAPRDGLTGEAPPGDALPDGPLKGDAPPWAPTAAATVPGGDGRPLPLVRFDVPLTRLEDGPRVTVEAPVVAYRSIRDTRARPEIRPVVRTRLQCGTIDEIIDVTLTRRSGMLFRMILGRRALRGRALVDPGRIFTAAPGRSRTGRGQA